MKNFFRMISLLTFAFFFMTHGFSQEQSGPDAVTFFKTLRNAIDNNLPLKFTGELSGKSIDSKIGNIPRDSYMDQSKRAYVQLAYSKKSGIAIIVRNVDELYRDLYRDLPKQIFAFDLVLSSEKNDSFVKKYEISYQTRNSNLVILRLRIRSAENALLLYVNPDQNSIQRIDYALGKQLVSSTIVIYSDLTNAGKRCLIPSRFITKTMDPEGRNRPDTIEVKNIQFK